MMESSSGDSSNGDRTRIDISVFNVIRTHKGNSRLQMPPFTNGWFGRSVENVSFVDEDDQQDCDCCPAPRSGHRVFATEDYIYLIGGYRPNGIPDRTFTDVWRFNMLTEAWKKCSVVKGLMPDCLASFSLVQTDRPNEVYAFGGTGVPFGSAASNDLYKFYINDNAEIHLEKSFITGEEVHKPPRIYGQAMCFVKFYDENKRSTPVIYLVGGTTGHEYNIDVWRLQLSDGSDETQPTEWRSTLLTDRDHHNESGRYRLEIIFHGNQLIAFGGAAPDFCADFDELLTFDLGTQTFTKLRTAADEEHGYPEGRKCHAIVEFEGEVYLIGGCKDLIQEPNGRRGCKMTNDVWKLNLTSMHWTKLNSSLPVPVFFHSAAITSEGCIYVFGGCTDASSQSRTRNIFRMWIRPPPLRHLAMRAIRACSPAFSEEQDGEEMLLSQPTRVIRNSAL